MFVHILAGALASEDSMRGRRQAIEFELVESKTSAENLRVFVAGADPQCGCTGLKRSHLKGEHL